MDVNGEAEDEEISVWEGFQQEDLADAMLDMFEEEDEKDLDWLPPKLEARRNKTQNNSKKGRYLPIEYQFTALITQPAPDRPKTYKKGPDVMSKSKRTQQRYQRTFRGQGKLTGFRFKAPSYPPRVETPKPRVTIRAAIKVNRSTKLRSHSIRQLPAPRDRCVLGQHLCFRIHRLIMMRQHQ